MGSCYIVEGKVIGCPALSALDFLMGGIMMASQEPQNIAGVGTWMPHLVVSPMQNGLDMVLGVRWRGLKV